MKKEFSISSEERKYFSLEQFNKDLWNELEALNKETVQRKKSTTDTIGKRRNLN